MSCEQFRIGIDLLAWGESPLADHCAWAEFSTFAQRSAGNQEGEQTPAPLIVYAPRKLSLPQEVNTVQPGFFSTTRTGRMIYQQFVLHSRICSDKLHALYCPYGVMPRYSLIPTVIAVHDTLFLENPQAVRKSERVRQKRFALLSLQRAKRILVPYMQVKDSLIKLAEKECEGLSEKIRIVPPATASIFCREPVGEESASRIRMAYGLPNPFVLACGPFLPRHNPLQIIQGWFAACTNRQLPHRLVLLDNEKQTPKRVRRMIHELGMDERVFIINPKSEKDRALIFRLSSALLMPTEPSEFRMEAVQASACGVPVVCPDSPLHRAQCSESVFYKGGLAELRQAIETALQERPEPATSPLSLFERAQIMNSIFSELIREDRA